MRYEVRPHVDLCSGIGGFALGFIAAQVTEPVLFCDFDEKVRKLLKVRFPGIPIANDVKEIANDPRRFIHERPFILSSGYPCQPFSSSGKRRGEEDPRHIFPHIAEIVKQTRPSYCVFENVYGHISLGLDKVLSQMGSLDYSTATFVVPAAGFRPHKRDRLWIICKNMADPNNEGIWTCERGSDVDNERLSGERRTDGARSSSNDGWNNIETTKDEGLDVANSDNTANGTSKSKDIKDKQTIEQRRKGIIWSEPSRLCADVANSESINRNDHEFVGKHGEEKAQEISRNRDGISDTQRQVVGNSECELGQTQLQWKRCLLREQNSERQAERPSDGDISEGGIRETFASFRRIFNGISGWLDEPRHIERTTHKNEHRNERLKQLGNALLPQITYRIGLAIKECEENK